MARPVVYTEEEVKEIVYRYIDSETFIGGLIKYKDVHEFAKVLFNTNKIKKEMSLDFWRKPNRLGRVAIDEANRVLSKTVLTSEEDPSKELINMDLKEFFTQNLKQKDLVLQLLLKLQEELRSQSKRNEILEKKLEVSQIDLNKHKKIKRDLNKKADLLQQSLLQVFEYSGYTDNGMIDLQKINNKQRTAPFITEALENAFSDPAGYLIKQSNIENENHQHTENLSKDEELKNKVTVLDDYDFI